MTPSTGTFTLAWSTPGDLAAARDCFDEVTSTLDDPTTFALRWGPYVEHVVCDGRALCVLDGQGDVAGLFALFPVDPATAQGQVFTTLATPGRLVEAGGLVVRPRYRHQHLPRRLLVGLLERAGELGYTQVFASVSPRVTASLVNLANHDFEVRARTRLYGADRVVLSRRLGDVAPAGLPGTVGE